MTAAASDPSQNPSVAVPDPGPDHSTSEAVVQSTQVDVSSVIEVLASTLGIEDQTATLDASTPLFGELPELDSLGVVELTAALEARFDIQIDDEDITGDVFETVGSLAAFVADKQG